MSLHFNDIFLRPLVASDINNRYISWFADPEVTRFLDARNIAIEDSKSYLKNGIITGLYYIFAICISKEATLEKISSSFLLIFFLFLKKLNII